MSQLDFDHDAYSQYMDDLNNSQGFYITPSRDGSVLLGGIRRVEKNSEHYERAERAAMFAVEEHNKNAGQTGSVGFNKIVNLNAQPTAGVIYYITMEATDASGEICHYEAKVWEKLNSGYQVQIFRVASYWLASSDLGKPRCCVAVDGLLPWMNESYIYYKCFYRDREDLVGVDVIPSEQEGELKAILWFVDCSQTGDKLKKYLGKEMPCTNKIYDFDLSTCPRKIIT